MSPQRPPSEDAAPTAGAHTPNPARYLDEARQQLHRYEQQLDKAAVRLSSLTLADPSEMGDTLDPFVKSALADVNALRAQVDFWRDMVDRYERDAVNNAFERLGVPSDIYLANASMNFSIGRWPESPVGQAKS